ncbi:MAG: cold-shock protein [Moraxellaceae bacterium]|nr:MAG: cold-shock protein [Moraxellaceae bacterium]
MRQQGILKQWNTDKGFGFIRPDDGGKDIFIHISAFPKDGVTPQLGEKIRYDISADQNGKPKAVAIERLDVTPIKSNASIRRNSNRNHRSQANKSPSIFPLFIGLLVVIGIVYTAYGKYQRYQLPNQDETTNLISAPNQVSSTAPSSLQFSCDGREHCGQMRSYEEAVYFIKNCPNTKMDGDGDGIPCESQF